MTGILKIELPDDFKKGKCTRQINMPSGKFYEAICPLYWHCQYHRAPTNCPLEIETDNFREKVEKLYHNFAGDDLEKCVKYGNKDAKQQSRSYSTMMMYEIADEFRDLLDK